MSAIGDWVHRLLKLLLRFGTQTGIPRGDVRHDIRTPITVRSGAFSVSCLTINISTNGLLVDRALEAKPGTRVHVTAEGIARTISGRIIRVGANSTAIRIDGHRGTAFVGALRGRAARTVPTFGDTMMRRSVSGDTGEESTTLLP